MSRLILSNFQSPGDAVVLTAAVRDLHLTYPGRFMTDVRTAHPAIWEHNPYLTEIDEDDPGACEIACAYPLVRDSNRSPHHFLHGFTRDLNERLGLDIHSSRFGGDIHLSAAERAWPECLAGELAAYADFWVIVSGGKYDFTVKWWDPARWQRVVDHFEGRIRFVQVGADGDHHPALSGVVDLRGRTDLRELIRVIHHARGVVTPVSLPMHLAAAVETPPGHPAQRPCVVVAGGREPPHWEAYPQHQFI
ncbi:MAG: glycosyltransferase family 9 protein, partial [Longimicrobiales bacterium]